MRNCVVTVVKYSQKYVFLSFSFNNNRRMNACHGDESFPRNTHVKNIIHFSNFKFRKNENHFIILFAKVFVLSFEPTLLITQYINQLAESKPIWTAFQTMRAKNNPRNKSKQNHHMNRSHVLTLKLRRTTIPSSNPTTAPPMWAA